MAIWKKQWLCFLGATVLCTAPSTAGNDTLKKHYRPPKPRYVMPLPVDHPILSDLHYFSFHGKNAASITLRKLVSFQGNRLERLCRRDPQQAFTIVGLIILIQKSLEGIEVQLYSPALKDEVVLAEVGKLLRQNGAHHEAIKLFDSALDWSERIPSSFSLTRILAFERRDILRQRGHHHTGKWNASMQNYVALPTELVDERISNLSSEEEDSFSDFDF